MGKEKRNRQNRVRGKLPEYNSGVKPDEASAFDTTLFYTALARLGKFPGIIAVRSSTPSGEEAPFTEEQFKVAERGDAENGYTITVVEN